MEELRNTIHREISTISRQEFQTLNNPYCWQTDSISSGGQNFSASAVVLVRTYVTFYRLLSQCIFLLVVQQMVNLLTLGV
jgi:hypothetical protein